MTNTFSLQDSSLSGRVMFTSDWSLAEVADHFADTAGLWTHLPDGANPLDGDSGALLLSSEWSLDFWEDMVISMEDIGEGYAPMPVTVEGYWDDKEQEDKWRVLDR